MNQCSNEINKIQYFKAAEGKGEILKYECAWNVQSGKINASTGAGRSTNSC